MPRRDPHSETTFPSIEWQAGYDARYAGSAREANPHDGDTDDQWDDGWLWAEAEILRKNTPAFGRAYEERPRR